MPSLLDFRVIQQPLNNNGVVGLTWLANGDLGTKLNDNAQLLAFQDIMQRFEKQVGFNYSNFEEEKNIIINIDKIKFGYLIVKQQDSGQLLWEPVWSFYGNSHFEGESPSDNSANYRPLIILNAIDGSNIGC